jgi:hypothetical protein
MRFVGADRQCKNKDGVTVEDLLRACPTVLWSAFEISLPFFTGPEKSKTDETVASAASSASYAVATTMLHTTAASSASVAASESGAMPDSSDIPSPARTSRDDAPKRSGDDLDSGRPKKRNRTAALPSSCSSSAVAAAQSAEYGSENDE